MTTHTGSLHNLRDSANRLLRALINFVKAHRSVILLGLSIVLIVMAAILVFLIVTTVYTNIFTCKHLIDDTLRIGTFCEGFGLPTENLTIIKAIPENEVPLYLPGTTFGFTVQRGAITQGLSIPKNIVPLLPAFEPVVREPLEKARKFVVWNIILGFAVVSLILAFIAIKMKDFVNLLLKPEGRRAILTNVNLWLLLFAIFCTWFYFTAPR